MKEIKLSQHGKNRGKYVALVDDEDYEYLNQWEWSVAIGCYTNYAARSIRGKSCKIAMHRIIMNTPDNLTVDHKDHNGLNNQKSNLKNCTFKENKQNSLKYFLNNYLSDEVKKLYEEKNKWWVEIKNKRNREHQKQILEYKKQRTELKIKELQDLLISINETLINWDN
jgi:hypothetical protein